MFGKSVTSRRDRSFCCWEIQGKRVSARKYLHDIGNYYKFKLESEIHCITELLRFALEPL